MTKKDHFIQCPQCNGWHWVKANDPPREFCLECLGVLERAARRRPPTEHPADGEKVLALAKGFGWNVLVVEWCPDFHNGPRFINEECCPVDVLWWWSIKHLIEEVN